MKRLFLTAAMAVFTIAVFAQNHSTEPCMADKITADLALSDPAYAQALQQEHDQALSNMANASANGNRVVYTIPIVFHVVYNTVNENVPDSYIYDQLETLNNDFRRRNADTTYPRSLFAHLGEDVEIEFCLAKRDPDNNSVVGITRTATSKVDWNSDTETNRMKQTQFGGKDPWDTENYLNVWIVDLAVNQSSGGTTAGYAYLGNSGIHGSSIDGIVLDYSIGFGPQNRSLTHEVGHYLGLRHTWGNNQSCGSDDGFNDTPDTDGPKFGCNLNSASCGSTDMIENYMDYADCSNMFTGEQVQYMKYVLQNFRSSLLSSDGCNAYPNAGYTTRFTNVCTGSFVAFEDTTFNDPDTWLWSFPGGSPSSSTQQNPVVYYDTPGTYDVTLQVSNQYGLDIDSKTSYLTVGLGGTTLVMEEDFEAPLSGWTILNPDNSITWSSVNVSGNNGNRAMGIGLYNYTGNGQRDAIVTPTIDLSSVTSTNLKLDYAYRQYDQSNNDSLIIYVSTNGGATYPNKLFANGGTDLASNGVIPSIFIPAEEQDWCSSSCLDIDLSAFDGETNVKIKIESYNGYGNNIYVDNLLLTGACTANAVNTQAPVAMFSSSTDAGCGTTEVTFTDESLYGATSWEWIFAGANPPQSSDTNPTVTYFTPGTYDVVLTVHNANGTDTRTITDAITISTELQVNVDSIKPACYGSANGDVMVDVNGGTPNYSYLWSNGSTNAVLTDVEGGDHTVTITDVNGCEATEQAFVYQVQGVQLQYVTTGDVRDSDGLPNGSIDLSIAAGTGVAPYTYQWSTGATSANLSGLEGGEYTVTVTDATGCDDVETITIASFVGIDENSIANRLLSVYPNPVSNVLNIELTDADVRNTVLTIYNITGKLMLQQQVDNKLISTDLSSWSSGAYLIHLTDGNSVTTQRIVKQ